MNEPLPPIMTRKEAKRRMIATYWTGSPCERNHSVPRYTADGTCPLCSAKARRQALIESCKIIPPDEDGYIDEHGNQVTFPKHVRIG